MESVEHLGQYVFEMTQAKVKAMGDGDITIEDAAPAEEDGLLDEDEDELMGADDDEEIV
jgi:intron-binding protein aquarius